MALQFNPPSFLQPRSFEEVGNIPQSLDQLFQQFRQRKQQQQQLDIQSGRSQLQTGFSAGELGQIGRGGDIGDLQARVAEFQKTRKRGLEADIRGKESLIEKREAETAGLGGSGGQGEDVRAITRQVMRGFPLTKIKGRGTKGLFNRVLRDIAVNFPDFDLSENILEFKEQAAGRGTTGRLEANIGSEPQWEKILKKIDPRNASKSSLIGVAANINLRADRELRALARPDVSPQQISQVITGLAAIIKGGVPTERESEEQEYKTLNTRMAAIRTFWLSKPSPANQPEVVERLRELITDIKEVDNKIIRDNIDAQEIAFRKDISTDPERFELLKENVLKITEMEDTRVKTRTLRDGRKVRVRQLPNGKWQVVE